MNEDGLKLVSPSMFAPHFENVVSYITLGVVFIWELNYFSE